MPPQQTVSVSTLLSPPQVLPPVGVEVEVLPDRLFSEADWEQDWSSTLARSLSPWCSWELPARVSDKFWLCPCRTEEMKELRYTHQGTAPFLLSLFSTFPRSRDACSDISAHVYIFFAWDDWLKKYSSNAELRTLLEFVKSVGDEEGNGALTSSFPVRLDRKYPGKKGQFLSILASSDVFKASRSWSRRYLACWKSYFETGLPDYLRLAEDLSKGETPRLGDFLVSRALTHGSLKWSVLALANQSIELSDETYHILFPLLLLGSMAACIYNDLFVKNIAKEKRPLNAVSVYSKEYASTLYSSILYAMVLMKEDIIKQVRSSETFSESLEPVLSSMDLALSSFHGITAWYNAAGKFKCEKNGVLQSRPSSDFKCGSKPSSNLVLQILRIAKHAGGTLHKNETLVVGSPQPIHF